MLREFLKLGATCAALAVFFTPLEAARKITRERNVGALTPVPFGAIALNCSIWVVYGIIVRDWVPLVASNAVGSASGVYCLGVFARHAKPPLQLHARRLRTGVVGGFACLLFAARGAMWRGVDTDVAAAASARVADVGAAAPAAAAVGARLVAAILASPAARRGRSAPAARGGRRGSRGPAARGRILALALRRPAVRARGGAPAVAARLVARAPAVAARGSRPPAAAARGGRSAPARRIRRIWIRGAPAAS